MYKWLILKNRIEKIFLLPFILIGRLVALLKKKDKEYNHFYFFPFYHIGGAEKVHYLIAQATASKDSIIYFTRKSKGRHFIHEFEKVGCVIKDISAFTDNKWIFPANLICRGVISYKINSQKTSPLVFNGQSNFGYKISPWISKKIIQVDLVHALNTFSLIRIPFLRYYKKSLTISKEIIDKHEVLYQNYYLPAPLINNLMAIPFGIHLPPLKDKAFDSHLRVLYVGRGSPEKRIDLVAAIAAKIYSLNPFITFSFAGDVESYLPRQQSRNCHLLGVVHDITALQKVYEEHDVVIVTSSTESGPLVIMEAMVKGLAVISTRVGIVPDHVEPGKNGFLFSEIGVEEKIINEGVQFLLILQNNRELLEKISQNNIRYAYENFGMEKFNSRYRALFQRLKQNKVQ